jgi:hypothetical protein
VRQIGYPPELNEDARSEKYKKKLISQRTSYCSIRIDLCKIKLVYEKCDTQPYMNVTELGLTHNAEKIKR